MVTSQNKRDQKEHPSDNGDVDAFVEKDLLFFKHSALASNIRHGSSCCGFAGCEEFRLEVRSRNHQQRNTDDDDDDDDVGLWSKEASIPQFRRRRFARALFLD